LLQYVDASLEKFLRSRATFRLQVGQLVVQEVECSSRKRNIDSCCVACCLLLCNLEKRYCCITVIRCCRCTVHSRAVFFNRGPAEPQGSVSGCQGSPETNWNCLGRN